MICGNILYKEVVQVEGIIMVKISHVETFLIPWGVCSLDSVEIWIGTRPIALAKVVFTILFK